MLNRLATTIAADRHAAAAAAVCAALLGCLIGLSVLIIASVPRAVSAELPCIVTTSPGVPCPKIIILGTATPPPTAAHVLTQAISAYGAPDTATLIGPVEAGRAFAPVAVSADGAWLQLDIAGSGLVWTTAASVDGVDASVLAVIATLEPTATVAPLVAEQPAPSGPVVSGWQQPIIEPWQPAPEAAPTSEVFPDAAGNGTHEQPDRQPRDAHPPQVALPLPTPAPDWGHGQPTTGEWGGGGGSGWSEMSTDQGTYICYGDPVECHVK